MTSTAVSAARVAPGRKDASGESPTIANPACCRWLLTAALGFAAATHATQHSQSVPTAKRNGDLDAPPEATNRLSDSLTYGAKFTFDVDYERNFDLDSSEKDNLGKVKPQVEIAMAYRPGENLFGFLNLEFSRELAWEDQGEKENRDTKFIVDEAYLRLNDIVEVDDVFEDVALQFGRQKIDDDREWLLDEELDAVRLFFESFDVDVELSVSQDHLFRRDLLEVNDNDRINNFIALAEYEVIEDWGPIKEINVGGYAVYRDNRTDNDDLLFAGLRSTGEIGGLEYWADVAHVRGNDGSDAIRGYGFDVGAVYTFDQPFDPNVVFGFAFGSGDSNPDDSTDRNFRQTDLQGNSDKLGGVVSHKYYGEVFDPELSNMSIVTAGIGFRPTRHSSINLVYHHYRLVELSDEVRDAGVEEDLEGEHRELGSEVDLVFGYRDASGVEAELIVGYFMPGDAYDEDADDALLVKVELSYEF